MFSLSLELGAERNLSDVRFFGSNVETVYETLYEHKSTGRVELVRPAADANFMQVVSAPHTRRNTFKIPALVSYSRNRDVSLGASPEQFLASRNSKKSTIFWVPNSFGAFFSICF